MKRLIKRLFPGMVRFVRTRRQFWWHYWRTGEWELRELHRYVDRSRGALDVGGNVGDYAYHLSRLAAWVRVFEPNPDYVARLRALGLRNTRIENLALSDHGGIAELRVPVVGDGREDLGMASLEAAAVGDVALSRTLPVELARMDDFALTDVGFIKIDVEGHEEAVVDGGIDTIRRNLPVLLIEIEERHNVGGLGRIAAKLAALGYSGFFFENGRRQALSQFDAGRHQRVDAALDQAGHDRRALAYVNNFLFVAVQQER